MLIRSSCRHFDYLTHKTSTDNTMYHIFVGCSFHFNRSVFGTSLPMPLLPVSFLVARERKTCSQTKEDKSRNWIITGRRRWRCRNTRKRWTTKRVESLFSLRTSAETENGYRTPARKRLLCAWKWLWWWDAIKVFRIQSTHTSVGVEREIAENRMTRTTEMPKCSTAWTAVKKQFIK